MRYIQPVDNYKRAAAYVGKNVRTTGGKEGKVINAFISKGIVVLYCENPNGATFTTDNEHATIWEPRSAL